MIEESKEDVTVSWSIDGGPEVRSEEREKQETLENKQSLIYSNGAASVFVELRQNIE